MSEWDFLWGLEGQELLDAMASGATYEEWAYIEEHEDGSIALFIDGENISSKYAEQIMEILSDYGKIAVKKVYGLQKDECTKKWSSKAKENDIKDIRLAGKPQKNKVDKKIIKDIKKTIHGQRNINTVCIVSCDGGYANIIKDIQDNGIMAIAIGTKKASKKLKDVCDIFKEI